jgi:regulator of protease activity HflC (stomatin/prohibitin superfamily)
MDPGARALEEALRSSFSVVKYVFAALIILFCLSGFTVVGPQQKAVVLHFGKPVGAGPEELLGPGAHLRFPYPIDDVIKIDVGQNQAVVSTIGWYATSPGQEATGGGPPSQSFLNPAADGYVLTSDDNIVHARATLHYLITDPLAYTFDFVQASNIVTAVLNNALIYAAAHSTADDAWLHQDIFREKVLSRVNQQVAALHLGITLGPSDVAVIVPGYVKPDFDAVVGAQQDEARTILTAQGTADAIALQTKALTNSMINSAQAQATNFVATVLADADSFNKQLPEYEANPDLYRQRLLAETWERVLVRAREKFVSTDPSDTNQAQLRLLLNRLPPKPETGGQSPL